jgi:phosphohistidine phosphatase
MKLYCVRHGQALPPSPTEPDPILSPEGESDVARVGSYLHKKGISASYIFSSYKNRAKQTAAILGEKLQVLGKPEVTDLLDPAKALDALVDEIEHWCDDAVLVGHLPFIGELVCELVSRQSSQQLVKFTPGTVVCLERSDGNQWVISWVVRADLLTD